MNNFIDTESAIPLFSDENGGLFSPPPFCLHVLNAPEDRDFSSDSLTNTLFDAHHASTQLFAI